MYLEMLYENELKTIIESIDYVMALNKMKSLKEYSDVSDLKTIFAQYSEFRKLTPSAQNELEIKILRQKLLTIIKEQMEQNVKGIEELGIEFLKEVNNLLLHIKESIEKLYFKYAKIYHIG